MKIGAAIKAYRYKHEIPMRDMAKELGVSLATVHHIEAGKPIDGRTISKLFRWLFG